MTDKNILWVINLTVINLCKFERAASMKYEINVTMKGKCIYEKGDKCNIERLFYGQK